MVRHGLKHIFQKPTPDIDSSDHTQQLRSKTIYAGTVNLAQTLVKGNNNKYKTYNGPYEVNNKDGNSNLIASHRTIIRKISQMGKCTRETITNLILQLTFMIVAVIILSWCTTSVLPDSRVRHLMMQMADTLASPDLRAQAVRIINTFSSIRTIAITATRVYWTRHILVSLIRV